MMLERTSVTYAETNSGVDAIVKTAVMTGGRVHRKQMLIQMSATYKSTKRTPLFLLVQPVWGWKCAYALGYLDCRWFESGLPIAHTANTSAANP